MSAPLIAESIRMSRLFMSYISYPKIILADEPTGNLDAETGRHIVELLRDISSRGTAVVMTTHNLQLLHEYPGIVYQCQDHRVCKV